MSPASVISSVCQGITHNLASSKPFHYTIALQPNISKLTFEGEVTTSFNVLETSQSVTLHSENLNIHNVNLVSASDGYNPIYFEASSICYNSETNFTTFKFNQNLIKGSTYNLTMKYTGLINKELTGLYMSKSEHEGKENVVLSTQFGPVYARRVFPSWDEPKSKATFDISLKIQDHLTALSNNKVESTVLLENNLKQVNFKRTPIMSTYILAVIVGEFDYAEDITSNPNIQYRIYAPKGHIRNTPISLRIAAKGVELYQNWFGLPYTLSKLDLVEVPEHKFSAMENWGLLTYKLGTLTNETSENPGVIYLVLHEIAHQWFGNLVSIESWDDYWIKESLATYFSILAGHHLYPQFNIQTLFKKHILPDFLEIEERGLAPPMRLLNLDIWNISSKAFGLIYYKGAAVMNMISESLSHKVFMDRIRGFLKKYEFGVVNSSILYCFFKENTYLEESNFFESWVEQSGYPYLEISDSASSDLDLLTLEITQHNFQKESHENSAKVFSIPFTLYSLAPGSQSRQYFIDKKNLTLTVPKGYGYYLTTHQMSFFRVLYPKINMYNLIDNLSQLSDYDKTTLELDTKSFLSRQMVSKKVADKLNDKLNPKKT